jgi:hypothetical protein
MPIPDCNLLFSLKYVELIVETLNLAQKKATSAGGGENLKQALSQEQVKTFAQMLVDVESSPTLSTSLVISFYNFIKFLLVKNYIDFEKQVSIHKDEQKTVQLYFT